MAETLRTLFSPFSGGMVASCNAIVARRRLCQGRRKGAPDAIQVADRLHLLCNLTSAVERPLESRQGHLHSAGQTEVEDRGCTGRRSMVARIVSGFRVPLRLAASSKSKHRHLSPRRAAMLMAKRPENKPSKEWNEVFRNAACIVTLLDRLLPHAYGMVIEGDSYRVRESEQEAAAPGERNKRCSDPAAYVATIITLYVEAPDTPLRASVSDQWFARRFHDDGVPLHVVETALLLGSTPPDSPSRCSATLPGPFLAYFRPVVDELHTHPAPESYLDYVVGASSPSARSSIVLLATAAIATGECDAEPPVPCSPAASLQRGSLKAPQAVHFQIAKPAPVAGPGLLNMSHS